MNLSSNFKVCCQGTQCRNDNLWISANITSNDALSVTVKVPDICNSKLPYGPGLPTLNFQMGFSKV